MRAIPVIVLIAVSLPGARAQDQDPRLQTVAVRDNVYMLKGNGGNIGLCTGEDGPFLIDDQFAPMVGQILAAVRKVSEQPVRFVINTHWHGDHTGGNERFGKAGALIVAHENVRKRMSVEQFMAAFQRRVPASPKDALPVITFTEAMTLHWNGDDVRVFHVEHAHTDGDAIVHFQKADVLHMGDVFFNHLYPFIDLGSGGSIDGMIAAVDAVLPLVGDDTRIIPGHGELADKADLQEYRKVLAAVRQRVAAAIAAGKTEDEVVASRPSAQWDEGWGQGFMNPERFLRIVYQSLQDKAGGK